MDHTSTDNMGVDTRGALGAEAPPDIQALYYTLYTGMANILYLDVINLKRSVMIVA